MNDRSAVWAGLLVALLGLVPLAWLASRPDAAEPSPEPTPVRAVLDPAPGPAAPSIQAVDPAVSAVLDAAGSITVLGPSDVAGVPPEIVRVLSSFEVPLLVPVGTPLEETR